MGKLVTPKVYHIGYTVLNMPGLEAYLRDSGNEDFLDSIVSAREKGLSDGEILTSYYAKLCYASLTLGKNTNVSRVRDIPDNLRATHNQGHGSVWEHAQLSFVVRNCSRVFTHELVRHRVGTAFSQTSGRYCRLDTIDLVWDSTLDPVKNIFERTAETIEDAVYLAECKLGLRKPNPDQPTPDPAYCLTSTEQLRKERAAYRWVPDNSFDFAKRKKITSAIRRIAPNGQANEIGVSLNLRTLRHVIQMRTSRHAEWEIREVFGQVYRLIKDKHPMLFCDAVEEVVDELVEVSGMRMQPYGKM